MFSFLYKPQCVRGAFSLFENRMGLLIPKTSLSSEIPRKWEQKDFRPILYLCFVADG